MKRLLAILLTGCVGLPLLAVSQLVPSKNAVGYVKLDVFPNSGFNFVSWNFRRLAPEGGRQTKSLIELFGTNQLRQAAFVPSQGDSVIVWDTADQKYRQFYQRPDGNFYDPEIGFSANTNGYQITPGQSFFLLGPSPGLHPQASETNTITVMGEVSGKNTRDQLFMPGFNAMNSEFSANLNSTNTDWAAMGATATAGFVPVNAGAITADLVFIFKPGLGYKGFFLRSNFINSFATGWADFDDPTGPDVNFQIRLGEGAWYYAVNGFTWSLGKPYSYPQD